MLASGSVLEINQTTGEEVGEAILWKVLDGQAQKIAQPLSDEFIPASIRTVAFDPSGKILAIGRGDNIIVFWDIPNKRILGQPLKAHSRGITSLAFSPDGRYLVSGSFDKKIALWDLAAPTSTIAVSSTGNLLATSQGSVISIWNSSGNQSDPLKILSGHTDDVLAIAFNPNNPNILISSGKDQTMRFWDIGLGQQIGPTEKPRSIVPALEYSPDGNAVAIAGESGRIQLLDPSSRETRPLPDLDGPAMKVQFGADGKTLDAVSRKGTLVTIDLTSTEPRILEQRALSAVDSDLGSVALSADNQSVAYFQEGGSGETAVLSNDGRARGIDIYFGDQSFDANVNRDDIDFIVVQATDGTQFVNPKFEEFVKSIETVPMRGAYHYFRENQPWQEQANLFLATVKDKGFQFYVLDLEVRSQDGGTEFLTDAEQWLNYVVDRVDGRVMLATGTLYLTDFGAAGEWMKDWPLFIFQYPSEPDPNGNPAMPKGFNDWRIWNYTDKGSGPEYGVGIDRVDLLVYNGTPLEMGQWLGINAFSILDRSTNEVVNPKQALQVTGADALAFRPDGSLLAVAGPGKVTLLSPISGDEISTLTVSGRSALSVAFLPDGNTLAIGTDDGTVLLWDLSLLGLSPEMNSLIDAACSQVNQNFTEEQWSQYVSTDTTREATCPDAPLP